MKDNLGKIICFRIEEIYSSGLSDIYASVIEPMVD